MPKDLYAVSYKTYRNDRLKPVLFHGRETPPLYVQVTFDRRSIFFRSYYFELFSQSKYDFLGVTLSQINVMEGRVIDYIIARNADRFDLDELLRLYKLVSTDVLDSFEESFKMELGAFFGREGFPGLAMLLKKTAGDVAGIRVWEDLQKGLKPDIVEKMVEWAFWSGHPYIPLAIYTMARFPTGPFYLPVYEWGEEEKRIEIGEYLDSVFGNMNMDAILRAVHHTLFPKGF